MVVPREGVLLLAGVLTVTVGQEGLMVVLGVLVSPFTRGLPQFLDRQESCLGNSELLALFIQAWALRYYVADLAIST